MTCFSPLQGYESKELTKTGKRKTTFNVRKAYGFQSGFPNERIVPCNRCEGCRIGYSRQWAVRCMHESSLYSDNSFITLTYNDQFLPASYSEDGRILGYGTLKYQDFTNFMKRLRKRLEPLRIRFYMGPEYGDLNLRPHYHALIFNYDFPDKYIHMERNGHTLFRSPLLEDLWTDPDTGASLGYSTVGTCTFQSAAYVARYMMKKVKGDDVDKRYERFNLETGEVYYVLPEKARMSNQSGIARDWFDLYHRSDVYNKDFVTLNGMKYRPPKFYDTLYERISPQEFEAIKLSRQESMFSRSDDFTPQRLHDRKICLLSNMKRLSRDLYKSKEFVNVT